MQKHLLNIDDVPTWVSCPPEAAASLLKCRTLVDLGKWVREWRARNNDEPGECFGRPRTMIESAALLALQCVEKYEGEKNEDHPGETAETP